MSKEVKQLNVMRVGIAENELILPKQPHHNVFLVVMKNVFKYSCWFGILGSKRVYWRVWSACLLFGLVVVEIYSIWKVIRALSGWAVDTVGHRSVTARLAGTIFYTVSTFSLILCSQFCLSWQELSTYWASVEKAVTLTIPPDQFLRKRLVAVISFMTVFGFVEHIMSIVSLVGLDCPPELILKKYTLLSHGFIILRQDYNDWMAIPILIFNTLATALWNFQDLLIVLISIGLTSRYHRLNQCVANISCSEKKGVWNKRNEALRVYTWRKIREAYAKQAALVRKINNALGNVILLSSFCNFYFICVQLFLGITLGKTITDLRRLYFVMSLAWLSIRVSSVVLSASDINIHSRKILKYLYDCDAHSFNIEIERLQNQLTQDYIALSGHGFFYLNKTILLKMASSIITYELVLIQFDNGGYNDTSNIIFYDNATHPQSH